MNRITLMLPIAILSAGLSVSAMSGGKTWLSILSWTGYWYQQT